METGRHFSHWIKRKGGKDATDKGSEYAVPTFMPGH